MLSWFLLALTLETRSWANTQKAWVVSRFASAVEKFVSRSGMAVRGLSGR
jgi:hypothetical protein